MLDLEKLAQQAHRVAEEAGRAVMKFYERVEVLVPQFKSDRSPLTVADQASHEILVKQLSDTSVVDQHFPVLSEEGSHVAFTERQRWKYYWCVDPLDGTKDFLKRDDEFTVNIALIHEHRPIIGVIHAPALQKSYVAWEKGGAYCYVGDARQQLTTTRPLVRPLRVLVSRYHGIESLQPWLSVLGETVLTQQGSALKFCTLASGEADLFLRLSPSSEWDNAAGHCIVREAGGMVGTVNGQELAYNCSGTLEQRAFIAVGDSAFQWGALFK